MRVIIERIVEASIDVPEFPLDGVIDILQVLVAETKEGYAC